MNEKIKDKLSTLPRSAGVYIMKDVENKIIYVGKAKNLKNRVSSYFNSTKKQSKVYAMVSHIDDLDYIVCPNQYDALALESNLIKKNMPFYNILLKDGKAYPYIKINTQLTFPTLELVRKVSKDQSKYFGPYLGGVSAYELINICNRAFGLILCKRKINTQKPQKPCLYNEMNLCSAPCANLIDEATYKKRINNTIKFLEGNDKQVQINIQKLMMQAVKNENFERAILLRTDLETLDNFRHTIISQLPKSYSADVFAFVTDGIYHSVAIGIVRNGKLLGMETQSLNFFDDEIIDEIIIQYYNQRPIPKEILINVPISNNVQSYLIQNGSNTKIFVPKIQSIKKQILEMAVKNAKNHKIKISTKQKLEYNKTKGAVLELQKQLGISTTIKRLECYDISHISGTNMVGSMVVFLDGKPAKKHYRKFKIKTVIENNDFASLQEILQRRFNELLKTNQRDVSFSSIPDLIIIDGGKGQLSAVCEIKKMYNNEIINNINIISLAKRIEEVFVPNKSMPIIINHDNESLKLLQRIRDEAHRFAITFHRQSRNKSMTNTLLDNINGIGEKRKQLIMKKFRTLSALKLATIDQLVEIQGITESIAKELINKIANN